MKTLLLGCALLGLAAGCASAPKKNVQVKVVERAELKDASANPEKTYICEEGIKTGTQIKGTQCQSVAEQDRQREAAQEAIHRMMMSGSQRK